MGTTSTITLRRWWFGLAAFYVSLVVHLGIYRFVGKSCLSTSCEILALSQILLTIGVVAIGLVYDFTVFQRIVRLLARIPVSIFLSIVFAILFFFGLGIRPEWPYAHMSIALSALMVLSFYTVYGRQAPINRKFLITGGVVLGVVVVILRASGLPYAPGIHILDEPWTMGWALSFMRTGQPSDLIMGNVSGFPYYSLPRYYVLVAIWFKIFGVGLWQGRLFSLFLTLHMVLLTMLAAKNLFNRSTAVLTGFVLISSSVVVVGLRLRHDIGLGLAVAASLWIYSLARHHQSRWYYAVAGLVIGFGLFAHYHAIGIGPALAIGLFLPEYLAGLKEHRRLVPSTSAVAYGLGALIGGLIVVAIQVLPDIEQFTTYLAPRAPQTLNELLETLIYHFRQVLLHSQLEFILLMVALAAAFIRRVQIEIALGLSALLGYLALSMMASKNFGPFDYYSVPLMPVLGMLVARLFVGSSRFSAIDGVRNAVLIGVCFLIPQLGYSLSTPLSHLGNSEPVDARPAAQWVLDNIEPDQTVLAEHLYYLWLYDYRFLSPLTPSYLPVERRITLTEEMDDTALHAVWDGFSPDIVIVDPTLATSGMLVRLRDSGYFGSSDFEVAYEYSASEHEIVTVYQRR